MPWNAAQGRTRHRMADEAAVLTLTEKMNWEVSTRAKPVRQGANWWMCRGGVSTLAPAPLDLLPANVRQRRAALREDNRSRRMLDTSPRDNLPALDLERVGASNSGVGTMPFNVSL